MKKFLNKNILIKYLIMLIFLIIFYQFIYYQQSELEQILLNSILIEISQANFVLYDLKGKIVYKYPIEIFIVYEDILNLDIDFSLLKYILKNQLKSVIILESPEIFNTWSPTYLDKKSTFVRGETFLGKIIINKGQFDEKEISFRFYYTIQDADGYNFEREVQSWPVLQDFIKKNSQKNLQNLQKNKFTIFGLNINTQSNIIAGPPKPDPLQMKIVLRENTLEKKIGHITNRHTNIEDIIKFYNDIFTFKPTIFMMFENKKKFQILITELFHLDYYYSDLLKKKNINNFIIKNKDNLYNQFKWWIDFSKNKSYKLENIKYFLKKY